MARTAAKSAPQPAPAENPAAENQVALSSQKQLAESGMFDDIAGFAGAGMEKVTARDILIPRLAILQALSDQVKPKHGSYIEGASVGDICDMGTNELMPRPLHFLPVMFDKVWIEWFPRKSNKGIANIHPTDEIVKQCKLNERGQPVLENGNLIQETAQLYGLNLSAGRRPSFIPFTSTQLKKARRWMTLAKGERLQKSDGTEFTPPLFFRTYMLDSVEESNNDGDWSGWVISRGCSIVELTNAKSIMAQCIDFRDSIIAGLSRFDVSQMTDDPEKVIDGKAEDAKM